MHFRKRSLSTLSLDETYSNNLDSKPVRREFGVRDERLAGCVDRITLSRAVRELPDGYRTIFLLHEVEGYEHQEIAELLGCSAGNSKSQLHKAKMRIRELLANPQKPSELAESTVTRRRKTAAVRFVERWDMPAAADHPLPRQPMIPAMPQCVESNG